MSEQSAGVTGSLGKFEFHIVRYYHHPARGEFLNIGILLLDEERQLPPMLRLTRHWDRLRCLHPDADIEYLELIENDLASSLSGPNADYHIKTMVENWDSPLRISQPTAVLGGPMEELLDKLMRIHVEPPPARGAEEDSAEHP